MPLIDEEKELQCQIVSKMQNMGQQLDSIRQTSSILQIDDEANTKLNQIVNESNQLAQQLNQAREIIHDEMEEMNDHGGNKHELENDVEIEINEKNTNEQDLSTPSVNTVNNSN